MDLSELDSCDICIETFDGNIRPHSLPCGHSICSLCVTSSVGDGELKCPHCRKLHQASSLNDFPINYNMESLILKLKEVQTEANKRTTPNSKAKSVKNKIQEILSNQKDSLESLIEDIQTLAFDVTEYKDFLQERKCKHSEFITKITDILRQNENMVSQIDLEDIKLEKVLKEAEAHQEEVNSNLLSLLDLTKFNVKVSTSDKLEEIYERLSSWRENCLLELPCVKMIFDCKKIENNTKAALIMTCAVENESKSSLLSDETDPALSVMEKVKKIVANEDLRSLQNIPRIVSYLLMTGEVYAVQFKDGLIRSARVTEHDNKKYLHYLQDCEPPQHAHILKQDGLIATLNTDCVVAFLDLEWEGAIRGRVHIDLSPDTPLAKHFWVLCAGHLGPTYAKSKFLEVENKGDTLNEFVRAGDYEDLDGDGGAPLFTGLISDDKLYDRKSVVGRVTIAYNGHDEPYSAQFLIHTGTEEDEIEGGIFGLVTDGLDIVREAVQLDDITKVTIADCGIVLPF